MLTKINGAPIAVNCDLMQHIEETPDTVITLSNGNKVVVKESLEEVIGRIVGYRRRLSGLIDAEYERRYGTE
ncbi:MAG: flagellar FlbD family protein [Acidobacteriota bacterium]|nr:flagellar FlbD family protein [Acidobacteriota bacterium]